jgi:hypothetical protein
MNATLTKKPIKVWFYSDARLSSERRTAAFAPRRQIDELVSAIANCMEMMRGLPVSKRLTAASWRCAAMVNS